MPDGLTTEQLAKQYKVIRAVSMKLSLFDEAQLIGFETPALMETMRTNRSLTLDILRTLIISEFKVLIETTMLINDRFQCTQGR